MDVGHVEDFVADISKATAFYMQQAALIAVGIVVAVGSTVYVFDHGGSGWWLLIAYIAIVISSGPMMLKTLNLIGAAIGSLEGPLVIIGFAVLLILLPGLAFVFFVVALVQAIRHRRPRSVASR